MIEPEKAPEDFNQDGVVDREDQLAKWRAADQEAGERAFDTLLAQIGAWVHGVFSWARNLPRTVRRTHFRLILQLVPDDVTDVDELYARTFYTAPVNHDHDIYRRTLCAIALVNRTPEQDLMFAHMLQGLREFKEDPLRIWISQALRRTRAPSTAPVQQVQGFLSAPIPGLNWLSQVLAALLVASIGWGVWRNHVADGATRKLGEATKELAEEQVRNEAIGQRMQQAEAAMAQDRKVLADYQNRVTVQAKADADRATREAAIRLRERKASHEVAQGDTGKRDDDSWLRELAGTASVGSDPVPAGATPAAPAGLLDGVLHEVRPDAGAHDLPKG